MHGLQTLQHLNTRAAPRLYTWTLYVANSDPHYLAVLAQDEGLNGTANAAAWGFGDWGVEPTVVLEVGNATAKQVRNLAYVIFQYESQEQAIYVVRSDGLQETWKREDHLSRV